MIVNTLENAITDAHTLLLPVNAEKWEDKVSMVSAIGAETYDLLKPFFKAEPGKIFFHARQGASNLLLLGLEEDLSFGQVIKVFRDAAHQHAACFSHQNTLYLEHLEQEEIPTLADAAVNGLVLGTYRIGLYKQEENGAANPLQQPDTELQLQCPDLCRDLAIRAAERGKQTGLTQQRMLNLVNAPGNRKTPKDLAAFAQESAREYGYKAIIFEKEDLERLGMHALLSVNRGSEVPARFILLQYNLENGETPDLALVGKGVTFDTGGLSLKPSTNMYYMKSDMGGAAAVMGAIELAAKLELPLSIVGAIPTTDNSVDALAIKPGDVIDSYSGKTIEVIDTDAEGRLILADGLAYVLKNYQPEFVLDLATLTGSAVRTFGYQCGVLFSNYDELANSLLEAGLHTGERLWQLPMWKEYGQEMKSEIADIKNLSTKPMAGAITAAKFLEFFTDEHPKWAHMDIAGVAFGDSGLSKDKSATAFGIRLLTTWMERFF